MSKLWLVLPFGLAFLPALLTLGRRAPTTFLYWAVGGLILWATGAAWVLGERYPPFWLLGHVAGPVASTLLLLGACRFARASAPGWLPRAGAAAALLTGVVFLGLGRGWAGGVQIAVSLPLLVASAWVVTRHAWRTRAALVEKALGGVLWCHVLLMPLDIVVRTRMDADRILMPFWVTLAFAIGFLLLAASGERASRRARQLGRERELLHRVARGATRGAAPLEALTEISREIRGSGVLSFFALWILDARGERLGRLSLDAGPPDAGLPLADAPRLGELLAGTGPRPLAPLLADLRLESEAPLGTCSHGFAIPIGSAGAPRGVFAAAFPPDFQIGRFPQRFVVDLADEVARILDHLDLVARERERATELEVERRTLLALMESAPLGIALTDRDGRFRYLNRGTTGILRIDPPEKWTGRRLDEISAELLERLDPGCRERLAARVPRLVEAEAEIPATDLDLDGGARIVELMGRPVRADDGRSLGRIWITRDVTEERQLDARLQRAQRMETVGTLAGGIAHDFNNQLMAILGNLEILRRVLPDDLSPQAKRSIGAAERSARHCAELTRGLLTFAQQRPPTPSPVPLEPLVDEVAALLRPGLAPDVRLAVRVEEGTGSLLADPDELRRVLMNLAVNARDAVAGRGVIEISARRLGGPRGPEVELVVSDDGVGMDEATRRRIFDPFFTTKEVGRGTGLGLSVVYGIAEAHGASIEVTSEPGRGSRFRLVWPAVEPAVPVIEAAARGAPEAERPTPSGTVLLGDDDAGVRSIIREMLEAAGYQVLEARDGREAVERFRDHGEEVDVLLLDLAMPRCSGLETLEHIRGLAPERPAILMSGNPDPFSGELPPDERVLLKPFSSQVLTERLREALAERRH